MSLHNEKASKFDRLIVYNSTTKIEKTIYLTPFSKMENFFDDKSTFGFLCYALSIEDFNTTCREKAINS